MWHYTDYLKTTTSDYISHQTVSSPITLLKQIALLLTAKLLIALQLVHTVTALLALRILHISKIKTTIIVWHDYSRVKTCFFLEGKKTVRSKVWNDIKSLGQVFIKTNETSEQRNYVKWRETIILAPNVNVIW